MDEKPATAPMTTLEKLTRRSFMARAGSLGIGYGRRDGGFSCCGVGARNDDRGSPIHAAHSDSWHRADNAKGEWQGA